MYCPKCGSQNSEGAKVCRSCSKPLPVLSDISQAGIKTSALAIWSFVLALIGLFTLMITALPALICGIISLVKISNSKGQLKGTGLAVTGIALSSIGAIILPLLVMMLAILMPALAKVRVLAQTTMCATNLSGLGKAIVVYTEDYNGTYPPADSWCDELIKNCDVSPEQFRCPGSDATEGNASYAFNINLSGKKTSEIPPDVVLLFETTPAVNPAGGPEILSTDNHQRDGCNVLFADGHVKFIKSEELDDLRWTSE